MKPRDALKEAKKGLKLAGYPINKTNLLKVLVDFYGLRTDQIEDLKLN